MGEGGFRNKTSVPLLKIVFTQIHVCQHFQFQFQTVLKLQKSFLNQAKLGNIMEKMPFKEFSKRHLILFRFISKQ